MQGWESRLDALEGGDGELGDEVAAEFGANGEAAEALETIQGRRVFDEVEEMELAGALLEVPDEAELDRFLGDLIRRAGRAVGSVVRSPVGQALGGILKRTAGQALPAIGNAIGAAVGGQAGAGLGGQLAAKAGQLFGLELEGLSPEDQEYEVARRVVRFSGAAAADAASAPPSVPPDVAARNAAAAAARDHAPGMLGSRPLRPSSSGRGRARSGRWIRRGRSIVIVNCNAPGGSQTS